MTHPLRIELPTEYEAGPVNAYLFMEPEPVLVDTGVKSEASWRALLAALAEHGLTPGDLSRVVLTHGHVDHFGQANRLWQEGGVRLETAVVVAHRLTNFTDYWQKRTAFYKNIFLPQTALPPQMYQFMLAYFEIVANNYEDVPTQILHTYADDAVIELGGLPWQVMHTPGHCSHQTIFYQPETRQLFSSDMLLQRTPTPVVELPANGRTREPSLPIFMRSLDVVESLEVDVVYPGHGEIFHDHRGLVRRQRERILRRTQETYACIQGGCHTAAEITAHLYADRPLAIQFAGLWMALGYVDLLLENGRITAREENGIILYEANGS
ncbi:MAG: MBL fold metallo-hydrolase [Ardenticatenaceae bacterium]|nr:MBL fold metallo-hydrolase [Ardenticatenaceae bacterium]